MAIAVSPIVPSGSRNAEVVYAKDQPQYLPLPAIRTPEGKVITRWSLSFRERLRILFQGNIWVSTLTFNSPLQPLKIETTCPADAIEYQKKITTISGMIQRS